MKITSLFIAMVLAAILGLAGPAAAAPVEPPEVEAELQPGGSMVVEKVVQTPEIPPEPDIYFLADTTGSMGGVIAEVAANAHAVLTNISLLQPDAQFGVGNYKDFPYDSYAFQNQQGITDDTTAVSDAINAWTAGGGSDGPEGQFYALTEITTNPAIGWRDGSTRIVVWFGDAPAHDPVPDAATGLGYDITESTVTADLQAAGVRVVAISTVTGTYYPDALDDDPNNGGGDYATAYGITEDGSSGQASRMAAATGGVHMTGVEPDEVVDAILEGLGNLPITITPQVMDPCPYLDIGFEPASQTAISGEPVRFTETIKVPEDAPQCHTLKCVVLFVDGNGNAVGEQLVSIHVLDVTPPKVWCIESVNPHGENIPGEKRSDNAKEKAKNPDGFYQILAVDNCVEPGDIHIYVTDVDETEVFGPFAPGIVVKFTEDTEAAPSCKKIGSSNGQAGAVAHHIILPSDPIVVAVDPSGNVGICYGCLVPPPPK